MASTYFGFKGERGGGRGDYDIFAQVRFIAVISIHFGIFTVKIVHACHPNFETLIENFEVEK